MLTVLVHRAGDPAALAQTLSPLVAGAVEGILREVVILDPAGDDARRVADHVGCRLAEAGEILASPQGLKGDWVLVVQAGDRLPDNWIDRILRHAGVGSAAEAAARMPDPEAGVFDRLFRRSGGAVLMSRASFVAAASASGGRIDALLRAARPRRMRR